jgi:hypothetical protein
LAIVAILILKACTVATRKMNSERTCVFFCPNTDEFEVAKAVRARYWTYMSSLKAKYNILKTEVVPTTLEEETDKAIRHPLLQQLHI